jgi:hypothetical protein
MWMKEVLKLSAERKDPNVENIVIAANKCDNKVQRVITEREGREFCQRRGYTYFETSAKTGENVVAMFDQLISAAKADPKTMYFPPSLNTSAAGSNARPTTADVGASASSSASSSTASSTASSSSSTTSSSSSASSSYSYSNSTASFSSSSSSASSSNASPGSSSSGGSSYTNIDDVPAEALSVKELKAELLRHRVPASEWGFEKHEMIERLNAARQEQVRRKQEINEQLRAQAEAQQAAEALVQQQDKTKEEIENWARGKDIRQMLNDIHGVTSKDALFLSHKCPFDLVSKSYKRALLKIHPDKVDPTNIEGTFRATEMFKAVNSCFELAREEADRDKDRDRDSRVDLEEFMQESRADRFKKKSTNSSSSSSSSFGSFADSKKGAASTKTKHK